MSRKLTSNQFNIEVETAHKYSLQLRNKSNISEMSVWDSKLSYLEMKGKGKAIKKV